MADRNRNPQQALFNPRQGWPLGNRSAAGEFVQRGMKSMSLSNVIAPFVMSDTALTFPFAFSTTPASVVCGPGDTGNNGTTSVCGYAISTTGFTMRISEFGSTTVTRIGSWAAIGT